MTKEYRSMIYVASAIIHLYSKDIDIHKEMSVAEFKENNMPVLDRVFEETKNVFGYELSGEQMGRSCYTYMSGVLAPQSVEDTEAFVREE